MKQFVLLVLTVILLASCYSKKHTTASPPENYVVREISLDSARIYTDNYLKKARQKTYFRQGMYIPVKILDALRTEEGINGIMVKYGFSPEFKSPVFIVTGSKEILGYKIREAPANNFAEAKAYLVYFPCPTHCN